MAKNKKAAPEPQAAPEAEGQPTTGYTIGEWAGRTQYRCKSCAFDCLNLDQMLDHLVDRHSPLTQGAGHQAPVEPDGQGPAALQPDEVAHDIYEIDLKED